MQDIRRPYTRSKSNPAPVANSRRDLEERVAEFENRDYHDVPEDFEEIEEKPVPRQSFEHRRAARDISSKDIYPRSARDVVYRDTRTTYTSTGNKQTWLFIGGIGVAVAIVGLLTFVFNSATVTIVPKYEDIEISKAYILSESEQEDVIVYTLASTTVSKSKALPLSETKAIESKASGKIVIYNNFDSEPQRLIKNTRFESAAGKIYRINQSVTVPGKVGTAPGSIEVTVYADEPGSSYNAGPGDFTVPGFKGTERYSAFFARSNGSLSGGASGNVSLVSLSDLDAAKDELALELTELVRDQLGEVTKEGHVPLTKAIKVVITDNEQALLTGEVSTYTATAVGYLPLVENDKLAKALATNIRDYTSESVRLDYADTLTVTPRDVSTIGTITNTEVLVEGKPRIVWITDEEFLKKQLIGKSKKDFAAVMSAISSVIKADIAFSPMWLTTFPTDIDKINVEENLKKR